MRPTGKSVSVRAVRGGRDEGNMFCRGVVFGSVLSWCGLWLRRFKSSLAMLQDQKSIRAIIVLSFVLEALRHCSSALMRLARESHMDFIPPGPFDWFDPSRSPLCAVQQYLSTFLAGESSRIILLWRTLGHASITDWYDNAKDDIRVVRRAVLVSACWLHRRLSRRLDTFPWKLVSLGNLLLPAETRKRLWADFLSKSECCLHPGFSRKVLAYARALPQPARDDLWQEKYWQTFWFWIARAMRLQCADIEWRHARNRRRSDDTGKTSFGAFCSRYVLAEAQCLFNARKDERATLAQRARVNQERAAAGAARDGDDDGDDGHKAR